MRDQDASGKAENPGPEGQTQSTTFHQKWSQVEHSIHLPRLADELSKLRQEMTKKATTPEHDNAVKAVAAAEQAAREGNGPKVLELLRSSGKWAYRIALEIGTGVAVEAIANALDL
jgi:hypothetical protein